MLRTLSSESMKKRRPWLVGTRPADVCGCVRSPRSSRSAMTFRTVAGDRSMPYRRVTVREPTASPVWRYSCTTAWRIRLARWVRSAMGELLYLSEEAGADLVGEEEAARRRAHSVHREGHEAGGDERRERRRRDLL